MDGPLFGPAYGSAVAGWQAKQNDRGIIYYANETLQITSWNHPYLTKLLDDLDVIHGDIKFAAYRTSFKLRTLQIQLGINRISYAGVKQMFAAHLAENNESGYLSCSEALAFIQDILEVSNRAEQNIPDLQTFAELILNYIMNLYDINRCGKVCSRSIKNALTALSSAKLSEKYKYFFLNMKDENQMVSKESLLCLIDDLMQITDVFKESAAFGRNARAAVRSCFHLVKKETESITERDFFMWLIQEPQTLVWLPTLHRITATETVQHSVSCRVCAIAPITGLRYRCLVCFKYDLCQGCFLHGHISHVHKFKHPMKEYCQPTSIADNAKAFLKIMKNKLASRSRGGYRTMYLPVNDTGDDHNALRQSLSNLQTCSARSTDSGLAESSSGGETVLQSSQVSDTDREHHSRKQSSKSVQVMGHPCNTSSPLVDGMLQESNSARQNDVENEQIGMALTIEQLQKENRLLMQKLKIYQQLYNAEHCGNDSFKDENEGSDILGAGDPLEEITTNSLISPIIIGHVGADNKSVGQENDDHPRHMKDPTVLDIVGAFTPVRSLALNELSARDDKILDGESEEISGSHDLSLPKSAKTALSQNDMIGKTTLNEDSTIQNGLVYRLSDMSLDCLDSSGEKSDQASHVRDLGCAVNERACLSNGLVCRSSDMSLDFLDSSEAYRSDTRNNIEVRAIISGHDTQSDLHLVNYSASSSSCEQKKNSQLASQSFCSNDSKKQQPSLIFSSASLNSNKGTPKEKVCFSETSFYGENAHRANQFVDRHTAETSFSESCAVELSEICSQSKYLCQSGNAHNFLHSNEPTPSEIKTAPRRKTIEPVYMSTPVIKSKELLPKSTLPPKMRSLGSRDKDQGIHDKENRILAPKNTSASTSFLNSKQAVETTPVSSLPLWQRKRILMSVNSLPSGYSQSCDNLTIATESVAGLSAMFKKAEGIGRMIGEDASMTMETQEKEELERLMWDLKKDCESETKNHEEDEPRQPADDDSMLEAVLNIGNAMADFVHATVQHQQ